MMSGMNAPQPPSPSASSDPSRPEPPVRRIGLTGGIGSGKSTVAGLLTRLGATVIDTDAISRELTSRGGAAMPHLQAAFGADVAGPDGSLDRERMRQHVFSDPEARQRLESILHPMIGEETARRAAAAGNAVVVFDVPLLVESGARWRSRVDRVLVVDCPRERQIERVVRRSGLPPEMVARIIDQQADRALRRACADAVIDNSHDDFPRLEATVSRIWQHWCGDPSPRPSAPF